MNKGENEGIVYDSFTIRLLSGGILIVIKPVLSIEEGVFRTSCHGIALNYLRSYRGNYIPNAVDLYQSEHLYDGVKYKSLEFRIIKKESFLHDLPYMEEVRKFYKQFNNRILLVTRLFDFLELFNEFNTVKHLHDIMYLLQTASTIRLYE
jgi:hypothetical protein